MYLSQLILALPVEEQINHPLVADRIQLGLLSIETGNLVACDPLYHFDLNEAFQQKMPIGEFPLLLYYTEDKSFGFRTAFASIEFSKNEIVRWEPALSQGQILGQREEEIDNRIEVETGLACFKDLKAGELYIRKIQELSVAKGAAFNRYDDYIEKEMADKNEYDFLNLQPYPNEKANLIFFSTGVGDGAYPVFFGYDYKQQPVCALIDFEMYTEAQYVYHASNFLKKKFSSLAKSEKISPKVFADSVSGLMRNLLHKKTTNLEFDEPALYIPFKVLHELIGKYFFLEQRSLVLIPMAVSLIESGTESYDYLIDFVRDMVLNQMGVEMEKEDQNEEDFEIEVEEEVSRIDQLITESNKLGEQGKYQDAIKIINELIPLAESLQRKSHYVFDLEAMYNNKAFFLYEAGEFASALEAANFGINHFPEYALIYHTKAEILVALKRHQEALININEAIKLNATPDKEAFREEILAFLN